MCRGGAPASLVGLGQRSTLNLRVSALSAGVLKAGISPEVLQGHGHEAQVAIRAQGGTLMNVSSLSSLNWDLSVLAPEGTIRLFIQTSATLLCN